MWGRIKQSAVKLLTLGATPNRVAAGFSLGLGLSLVPIPVVGMLVALALAPVLRVNPVATYVGTAVVNPITGTAIYFFELWVGMAVMGLEPPAWANLRQLDAGGWWVLFVDLLGPFAIGAAIVATTSSLFGFLVVRTLVARYQRRAWSVAEPSVDPLVAPRNSHPDTRRD